MRFEEVQKFLEEVRQGHIMVAYADIIKPAKSVSAPVRRDDDGTVSIVFHSERTPNRITPAPQVLAPADPGEEA